MSFLIEDIFEDRDWISTKWVWVDSSRRPLGRRQESAKKTFSERLGGGSLLSLDNHPNVPQVVPSVPDVELEVRLQVGLPHLRVHETLLELFVREAPKEEGPAQMEGLQEIQ